MDQTQTSILEMWWSLVQDQVGAMSREIESLRLANAQIQVRLAEVLTQRTEANESSKSAALIAQEVQRLHAELHAEKEERSRQLETTREGLKDELRRHEQSIAEQLQRDRVQSSCLSEEVGSLQQALELEKTSRCDADQALGEQLQKLVAEVQQEHQHHVAEFNQLQHRVEAVGKDIDAEREEWTSRRSNLLGKILQHISDQDQSAKQERQLLERQKESDKEELQQLIAVSCAKERESTKAMLERAQRILDSDDALREKLQVLLHTDVVSKADFASEAQRIWQAIKPETVGGTALADLARVRPMLHSTPKPPVRESSSFLRQVGGDVKNDFFSLAVNSHRHRGIAASSRGSSPSRTASLQPTVLALASSRASSPSRTASLQPTALAPTPSRGSSPVRTAQSVGQAVKLVTYRSPSAGMCSAVMNVDLPPGDLQSLTQDSHRSVVSSVTTLPPSDDVLSNRSDLGNMLQFMR